PGKPLPLIPMQRLVPAYDLHIEPPQRYSQKAQHFPSRNVPPGAQHDPTTKGPVVRGALQAFIAHESFAIHLLRVLAEACFVQHEVSERHEDLGSFVEDLAADPDVVGDFADVGGGGCRAESLVEDGIQERALGE
ncbi:MAG: hypothetical protein LQ340_007268, partial [Diploschistes diacapsis]